MKKKSSALEWGIVVGVVILILGLGLVIVGMLTEEPAEQIAQAPTATTQPDEQPTNRPTRTPRPTPVPPTIAPEPEPTPVPPTTAPEPEPTPTLESTIPPEPTQNPIGTYDSIILSGAGNVVTDPMTVPFVFARVMYNQDTDGLIQARAYPTTGDRDRLIVNEIGANTGAWLFTASEEEYYFEVEADEGWTITIEPLSFTDQNLDTLNGTGAWVTDVYQTNQQGNVPYVATHEGPGLAQIRLHCSDRSDLVLNEIGTVTSETVVRFSGDLCFWEIEADQGEPWSFAPR